MAFTLGDTVGPYRIVDQIGQGGMATVYKAYHANLDRYVAFKVLHQAFTEDPGFLERFKREAQIVARLEHPNIIPVYDFADHQNQPYLVMKFIEGQTLKARLKRTPLTLEETVYILEKVADGLSYAHRNGILHRDIKPSNIMLDTEGMAYIADFGLARIAQAGESTMSQDMMLGTPQYISPEQAKGLKDLGPGTDIYSLGVLLYEVVVGRVPFSADTPYAIVHDHIYKALPLPTKVNPSVPVEVERVLLKALAKEPEGRYTSALEMVADFKQAVIAAGMTELSAAKYRPAIPISSTAVTLPEGQSQPVTPVTPAIPSPLTQVLSSTGSTASKRAYRRRANLWILSGVGALLFTCLASLFIIVAAVSDPELRPWNMGDEEANAQVDDFRPPDDNLMGMDFLANFQFEDVLAQMTDEEAQTYLEEKVAEGDSTAALALAMLYIETGNREEAFNTLIILAADPNSDPGQLSNLARRVAQSGFDEFAAWLYLEALTHDEIPPRMADEAGEFLYTTIQADPLVMRTLLSRFAESHDESAVLYTGQALTYTASDRTLAQQQAKPLIDAAFALNDSLPEAYLVRGLYFVAIGQIDDALDDFARAATFDNAPEWVVREAENLLAEYGESSS
ncbi:MAG: serine/threonine protein kinase [Anaerolineae bacterium]|nr:serine/threonine protein kinase [Anaerolineae bacterium]